MTTNQFDLPRAMLQVLAIGILILSALWIVSPFLAAVAWATTIVVATWPLFLRLESLLTRRSLAVAAMTITLLLVLIVPLSFGIKALVDNSHLIVEQSKSLATFRIPEAPAWVGSLPLVGAKISARWQYAASLPPDELTAILAPYAQRLALWVVQQVGSIGLLVVNFLLTVLISAILYTNGESAGRFVLQFARRIGGQHGEEAAELAAGAIRGVALGVIVTATLQTVLVAIGLLVVQVPFAPFLIGLAFVFSVAQVGPFPVLLPVTIWLYSTSGATWGTAFLVWSLVCGLMDNFVRPVLIRRGADLPLILIFSGVIGGLLAMGVIGLFVGPVVLAVAYTLLTEWVSEGDPNVTSA